MSADDFVNRPKSSFHLQKMEDFQSQQCCQLQCTTNTSHMIVSWLHLDCPSIIISFMNV